ncbi:MAG: hypothetical protein ACKVZH_20525 [Blastocatellia bacterium]
MYWTSKVSTVVLIGLLLSASSCSKPAGSLPVGIALACPSPSPQMASNGKLKLFIPDEHWIGIFFDSINKRAAKAELTDLKSVALTGDDLEIRVWEGFGLSGLGGFVLKRSNGYWEAIKLRPLQDNETQNPRESYPEPVSGWDAFWERLVSEGLLTLPDGSCFKDYLRITDGVSYVVEINMNGSYRTYEYSNPLLRTPRHGAEESNGIAAAKQMTLIASFIFGEYRLMEDQ